MTQHYIMMVGSPRVKFKCYVMADKIADKYNEYVKENKHLLVQKGWKFSSKINSFLNEELRIDIVTSLFKNSVDITFTFDTLDLANKCLEEYVKTTVDTILKLDKNSRLVIDISISDRRRLRLSPGLYEQLLYEAGYRDSRMFSSRYRKFETFKKINITTNLYVTKLSTDNEVEYAVDLENSIINTEEIQNAMNYAMYYYYLQYIKLHYELLSQIQPSFIKVNNDFYKKVEAIV